MNVPSSLGRPIVGEEKLAPPERAVLAEPETVEHDAEHRRPFERPPVLREAGRRVRVVVLNLDER